jgi:DNA polymerase III delta subunit
MAESSVVLFSGTDGYRLRKFLGSLAKSYIGKGWRVERGDATLENVNQASPVGIFQEKAKKLFLLFVMDAKLKKKKKETMVPGWIQKVVAHSKNPKSDSRIALWMEGNPKKGGAFQYLVEVLPAHRKFALPTKFWEVPKDAMTLCIEEAEERGKILPEELAQSLVEIAGTDLGFLSHEVLKLCTLLDYEQKEKVTPQDLSGTIAQIGASSVGPLVDAVGAASIRKVSNQLRWIEKTHAGDPTIKVCRFLAPTVLKWYTTSILHERGISPSEAASEMGAHKWYHKTKLLPVARRWGAGRLWELLGILAASERDVLKGRASPWVGLCARLLRACYQLRQS